MRNATTGIRRPVERIDDDDDVAVEIFRTRLLRKHAERRATQQGQRRLVRQQIGTVLTMSFT